MRGILVRSIAALAALFIFAPAHSAAVSLVAADSGFITEAGGTDKFDGIAVADAATNYSVGWELHYSAGGTASPTVAMQRKNYFVFDLSTVIDPIMGATLKLFNPVGGYESIDPTETFEIGATDPGIVPAVLADLTAISGAAFPTEVDDPCPVDPMICIATGIYPALADTLGPLPPAAPDPGKLVLASAILSAASDGTIVDVVFTAAGVDYLNLFLGSTVVLAGGLPTGADGAPSGPGVVPQSVFGGTGLTSNAVLPPELELTVVPVPAAAWLFASGLGLLGFYRCRCTAS